VDSLRVVHTNTGNVPDVERNPDDVDREDPDKKDLFSKLRSWLEHERDRQAENRAEMAIDADNYDGLQWTEEDARVVEARGQAPLVFNEIKVNIDWILGAEKRNRVDWRVLPREESDGEGANVRSKVLKYLSDVNRTPFTRSQAFAEAAISGLSWLEDSLSMDATEDVLHSGQESWRNILHDSYHKRPDYKDARYLFRWRYVDLDIAQALWPHHADALERQAQGADQLTADADDELWYLGANLRDPQSSRSASTRHLSSTGSSVVSDRRRVKIYEAWYREPTQAKVLFGGAYHGDILNEKLPAHQAQVSQGYADAVSSIVLRMRVAFMTEAELLEDAETPYAHNQFPFTPLYCFRRGRDGMPYGHVRPMRDPQMDMNKRMSKSLFLLSVNQLIAEKSTFSTEKDGYTLQDALDNVSNPQGYFILEHGEKKFEIRRDFAEIRGHFEILAMDRQFLQSASGVNNEQLGRDTNVISGKGILAKQEQGALTTSGIFDNYRLAISVSGQKSLSNVEKFYSMPKVIRLTETQVGEQQPKISWVKINQPEVQPDGSVRFANDITQAHADFIVDEQDYRASMRQAMFDQLLEMLKIIAPVAPAIAVGLLDIVCDANDFPGKEEMVQRIRTLIAEARGELKSPEQKAAEAEVEALKKAELAAKIAKDDAAADKLDAEADTIRSGLQQGMVALDLERTAVGLDKKALENDRASGAAPPAAKPAKAPAQPSMAPQAAAGPPTDTPSAGAAPPVGAAPAPAGPDVGQLAQVMQQQGQQLQQMLAQQASVTMQMLAQLAQEIRQLSVQGGQQAFQPPPPRSKTIRIKDPTTGRDITAVIEVNP
jgi:hypothetical protein